MLGDCHWCIPHQKVKDQSHDRVTIMVPTESREWSSCFTQNEKNTVFSLHVKDQSMKEDCSCRQHYFLKPRDKGLHRVRALLARLSQHRTGLYTVQCTLTLVCSYSTVWRTASLRSAPHQQTPEPVYIVVDKLVHCDPNMYSQLCTEIYLSLVLALA